MNYIKYLLPFILSAIIISCNSNSHDKATPKESPGYTFPTPKGWQTERIAFPIEFAPKINYTGFEDLRFTPGWEFTTSEEHWCYAFLWWLNGNPKINDKALEENLKIYYTGLVEGNIRKRNIPAAKVIPAATIIKQIETSQNDVETYKGSITITDYLDIVLNPITLNCLVHKKNCGDNTVLIFEISPKAFDHEVWRSLNKLQEDFKCGN